MIKIGLTGSMGMGKSTTAEIFKNLGIDVYDADKTVEEIYQGEAVVALKPYFPNVIEDNKISKAKLRTHLQNHPKDFEQLEAIIHPILQQKQQDWLKQQGDKNAKMVVFDIPLLYENALETTVDAVIVVDVPLELRIHRVQERSGLSEDDIRVRDAAQLELTEKVKRADYVIDNSKGLDELKQQVDEVWSKLIDLV